MSFAIWYQKPSFTFKPEDREQIYKVGEVWVVTDDAKLATKSEVDRVRNAAPPSLTVEQKLAVIGLTVDDIKTAAR